MLKPRYGRLTESVSDFNRMLEGMNKIQPLERKRLDEDTLDMFRTDQALVRFEQQIEHAYRAIYGSGMPISEGETASLRQMHLQAAEMYESAADEAEKKFKERSAELKAASHDSRVANLAKMKAHIDALKAKASEHFAKSKPKTVDAPRPVADSVMHNMRSLAGLVERVQMPRDPGLSGTTRFVAGYDQMAEPFEESKAKHPSMKKESQSIEDRLRELREGRSKLDQKFGHQVAASNAGALKDVDDTHNQRTYQASQRALKNGGDGDAARETAALRHLIGTKSAVDPMQDRKSYWANKYADRRLPKSDGVPLPIPGRHPKDDDLAKRRHKFTDLRADTMKAATSRADASKGNEKSAKERLREKGPKRPDRR